MCRNFRSIKWHQKTFHKISWDYPFKSTWLGSTVHTPAPGLIVAFRKQNEIISLWKRASSQLEKRSPWEVSHFMLPFSYWLWLAVCKRQTNAILNKIMDLFHNEIISFCQCKATIRLAACMYDFKVWQIKSNTHGWCANIACPVFRARLRTKNNFFSGHLEYLNTFSVSPPSGHL
jgi:hypothetical protein